MAEEILLESTISRQECRTSFFFLCCQGKASEVMASDTAAAACFNVYTGPAATLRSGTHPIVVGCHCNEHGWCNEPKSSVSMVPINYEQECHLKPTVVSLLLLNETTQSERLPNDFFLVDVMTV